MQNAPPFFIDRCEHFEELPKDTIMRSLRIVFLACVVLTSYSLGSLLVSAQASKEKKTRLGNFSVSLAVKDIAASKAFYEKLGFQVIGGDQRQNWLILQNDSSTIGLFQGMFAKNMLTFNPGWDRESKVVEDFDDVRAIQAELKSRGIELTASTDENADGPAHIMVTDPDGNPILIDQHVPKAKP